MVIRGPPTPDPAVKEKYGTIRDRVYSAFTITHPKLEQSQPHATSEHQQALDSLDDKVEIAEVAGPPSIFVTPEQDSASVNGNSTGRSEGVLPYSTITNDIEFGLQTP